jgi:hypothetical protein
MKIRYPLQIGPEKVFHMLADFKEFGTRSSGNPTG